MGQIARLRAANRFIAEFGNDYEVRSRFQVGQTLTVTGVHLGCREGGEAVVLVLHLVDAAGHEVELEDGYVRFDPEYYDGEDLIDWLADDLGLTEDEARQRLNKVQLTP